jgi:hypothetical protein
LPKILEHFKQPALFTGLFRFFNTGGKKMFWKKKSSDQGTKAVEVEKEARPRDVPGLVQKYLISEKKVDPEFAPLFKAVIRHNGTTGQYIRIYDESDAAARKIQIKNYASLDEKPEMIIWEGLYDEGTKKVELIEKNKLNWDTPIYTESEILKKIEALTQPGSTVFFYQARGPKSGGPLSKGANIIELNPQYPGKKQKKYNINVADVVDNHPVDKGEKLWDTDKPKDIAAWVIQSHHKRIYS